MIYVVRLIIILLFRTRFPGTLISLRCAKRWKTLPILKHYGLVTITASPNRDLKRYFDNCFKNVNVLCFRDETLLCSGIISFSINRKYCTALPVTCAYSAGVVYFFDF